MRKKTTILLSSVIIGVLFSGVAYSASGIKLMVNGHLIQPEVPPQIIDGSTMVPIRAVSEALGANVQWNEAEQTVTVDQAGQASLQRQIELLQSALAPESADDAVNAWAKAVKSRNGAVQYALLGPELQSRTAKTYEELNWVTGVSSPWVGSYQVSNQADVEPGTAAYDVAFQLKTSTGNAGEGTVRVTVGKQDDKWKVMKLETTSGSDVLNGIVIVP